MTVAPGDDVGGDRGMDDLAHLSLVHVLSVRGANLGSSFDVSRC
jgi:hypothetical protein